MIPQQPPLVPPVTGGGNGMDAIPSQGQATLPLQSKIMKKTMMTMILKTIAMGMTMRGMRPRSPSYVVQKAVLLEALEDVLNRMIHGGHTAPRLVERMRRISLI